MSVLDDARALVAGFELPEDLIAYGDGAYYWDGDGSEGHGGELHPATLAESLSYQIALDGTRISDESDVALGASKYRGLPHLPPDMPWPEGLYFALQLNLEELAKVDRLGRLPDTGMLYFFFDSGEGLEVVYWDGAPDELEVREYPDPSTLQYSEYYLDDFLKGETIKFKPYWLFYFNHGDAYDYRDIRKLLPAEMVQAVSSTLGASIATWDSSCRLYGRPHYWQGEDEFGGWPDDFDEEGNPIWNEEDDEPEFLLFQDEFGEGNIHFWCAEEAASRADFSGVWLTYSGT
jgi:hypothetical protein